MRKLILTFLIISVFIKIESCCWSDNEVTSVPKASTPEDSRKKNAAATTTTTALSESQSKEVKQNYELDAPINKLAKDLAIRIEDIFIKGDYYTCTENRMLD